MPKVFFHDQQISIFQPLILDPVHQLSHEMDSQSACRLFIEGRGDVRFGHRERVESPCVIFHFRDNFFPIQPNTD